MGHVGSHDCVPTIASTVFSTWIGGLALVVEGQ